MKKEFLTQLFKLSYNTGTLPNDWNLSRVIALFKKGSRSIVNNYRPISLTCIIRKILEPTISDNIAFYFKRCNILSNNQLDLFLAGLPMSKFKIY